MKLTKQRLKQIIREEKARLLSEALPPHLQKHFRADGSSVKDPEWEDVTPGGYGPDDNEIIELPSDLESPASDQEIKMEELTVEFEKRAKEAWFAGASIRDPFTGEKTQLDTFLALLGNRVVSGNASQSAADDIVQNIHNYLESAR